MIPGDASAGTNIAEGAATAGVAEAITAKSKIIVDIGEGDCRTQHQRVVTIVGPAIGLGHPNPGGLDRVEGSVEPQPGAGFVTEARTPAVAVAKLVDGIGFPQQRLV